jgi:enoyl-CoA hydratase/carnithine racemase
MSDLLRVDDHGPVRLLTLDRPDVLNAFNTPLYEAAAAALDAARADDAVSVVVLTGAGRAFSAGQDLGEMADLVANGGTSGFPVFLDALSAFDKPVIAAVNGVGVGIGFTLLAHCDLVLVDEGARLRAPFAPLGVPPEAAASVLFPARLGWQRAAHVLLTGAWVSAAEAVDWGIALRVAPAGTVVDEALALAATVAEGPLPALRAIKTTMLAGQSEVVAAARSREDAAFSALLGGAANAEALDRFNQRG